MNVRLDDLGVAKDLLNRFTEKILSELFETGTNEGSVLEIDTLEGRVDFGVGEERVRLAHSQAVRKR